MIPLVLSAVLALYLALITVFVTPDASVHPQRSIPLIDTVIRDHFPSEEKLREVVPYKNHCYRVYNLALKLAGRDVTSEEKEILAIALGFHDLSLFADGSLDYLEPSASLAEKWMKKHGKAGEDVDHVKAIIMNHHKFMAYEGKYQDLVEAVRKADMIDVSMGLVTYNLDRSTVKALRNPIPTDGFHWFLVQTLAKWAVKHPENPIPFLRW